MDCGLVLEDEDISDARDMRMVFEVSWVHPSLFEVEATPDLETYWYP
jgi:hypothetical protein